jgi:hypothetical protein
MVLTNSVTKATANPAIIRVNSVSIFGYYYETPENCVAVKVFTT